MSLSMGIKVSYLVFGLLPVATMVRPTVDGIQFARKPHSYGIKLESCDGLRKSK